MVLTPSVDCGLWTVDKTRREVCLSKQELTLGSGKIFLEGPRNRWLRTRVDELILLHSSHVTLLANEAGSYLELTFSLA